MKIYNVSNTNEFFKRLDKMKGDTKLVMPDGKSYKWHVNGDMIRSIFSSMPDKTLDNVEVVTDNDRDTVDMLNFLMRGSAV